MEESSHMTLAHTSRSSFHLSPALRCGRAASGSTLESGAGLIRRLTFQSQLSSVLGKVLDVYIFSHFQSSLQHCEMNVIIPTSLISKLSLREVNSFSQGHTASVHGFALIEFPADHPVLFLIESPRSCTQQGLSKYLLNG